MGVGCCGCKIVLMVKWMVYGLGKVGRICEFVECVFAFECYE